MADSGFRSRVRARRRSLRFTLAFLLVLGGLPAGAAQSVPADVLVTTGDTRLSGTLEEAHLSVEAFGAVLQLPLGFVASLTRLDSGQARLELINHDVLTGTLRNRELFFSTPSARMAIPVEKVKSLALQARQTPPEAQDSLLLSLKNGDTVAWLVDPAEQVVLSLSTTFSDPVRLQLDKVRTIRFKDGGPDVVEMRNGDLLYGRVQDALLRVRTYYQSVEIPRSEVASLTFLGKAEAKVRFTGAPAPAPPPAPAGTPAPAPAPVPVPAPAGKTPAGGPGLSAANLTIQTAEPLAEPRVADTYQPFSGHSYGPSGELAVAVGVPGTNGEKTGREIWVYFKTGKRVVIGAPGEASSPAWHPDAQRLAYDFRPVGVSTSEIWLAADDGSSRRQVTRDGAGSHASLAWSPEGKRLAYVTRDYRTGNNGVWVLNLETGTPVSLLTSNFDYFSDLAWSPDGRELLVVSGVPGAAPRSTLKLIDVAGKVATDLLPKAEKRVNDHPRWSPDGQLIAFSSDRSGARQIWLVRPDGTGLRQLTSGEEPKDFPVWSPDGRVLLYLAGRSGLGNLYVIDAEGGAGVQLTASGRITGRTDWSPDGRRLVFTKREQAQQLWTATLASK